MPKHYPLPVIVGTDLTGLLISIALSRAKISHVLIGDPPGDKLPRSGQILTPVGSTIFSKYFPELAHLGHAKRTRVVHIKGFRLQLDFANFTMTYTSPIFRHVFGVPLRYPLNLDRVAADQAFYDRAINNPYCTHLRTSVARINYDPASDLIESLILEDGARLHTSHLFDATGHERFVGERIGLGHRTIGAPQVTAQAVYAAEGGQTVQHLNNVVWYQETASVVRLYRSQHGIDGLAACIPLGDKVAIHVNAPADSSEQSADDLLELAQVALNEYGIHYQDYFPNRVQQGSDAREQYVHTRAYGANWLLTGNAYLNTWMSTAASIDTSFAALHTADQFIKAPQKVGDLYQIYMDYYLIMQKVWHLIATHEPATETIAQLRHALARYTWANQAQFLHHLQMQHLGSALQPGFDLARRAMGQEIFSHVHAPYSSVQDRSARVTSAV